MPSNMPRVVVATHHGVVIALNYFRSLIVFVQFLINVRGIADEETFSYLWDYVLLNTHLKLIPDPSSAFTVRQVVHRRVLECDP